MKVLRLAWSSYQTPESLRLEAESLDSMGLAYERAPGSGRVPDDLHTHSILLINSRFTVDEPLLDRWSAGPDKLLITTTSGYDHIAPNPCLRRNVTVARTPRARADNVVNHALAMIDSLHRNLPAGTDQIGQKRWNRSGSFGAIRDPGRDPVGVVGHGVIGRRMTGRLVDRGVPRVLVHDPNPGTDRGDPAVEPVPLPVLLEQSRTVTLHASLTETSRGLIGRQELEQIGPEGYLINTARGELVDESALVDCLREGKIAGAALDVFDPEPPRRDWPAEANLILTPHTAGFGPDLLDRLREEVLETVARFLEDEPLPHPVDFSSPRGKTA